MDNDKKEILIDRLLAATFLLGKKGSLENIKKVLTGAGFGDLTGEDKRFILDVVGTSCLNLLKLEDAAKFFKASENFEMLQNVFDLACRHGKYRLVKDLISMGKKMSRGEFILGEKEYDRFLREKALPYTPMFRDEKRGFGINKEILEEIVREISGGKYDRGILADCVRFMEKVGSRNTVKKFIFSYYSGDDDLIRFYKEKFDILTEVGRKNLEDRVGRYCARKRWRFIKTLQECDGDDFFGSVAGIFLIDAGAEIVLKENLYLHQDYSSLSGYSMEKEILEILRHDNIVGYCGSEDIKGIEFLKLKFVSGALLDNFSKQASLLSQSKVLKIFIELAEVIKYMHEHNVISMDIKEKNAIFDGKKTTLFDFGVSRIIPEERRDLDEPYICSLLTTPEYVAPEMALTFKAYKRTDVFQLGIVVYRLFTGRNPFICYDTADFTEGDDYRESEIIKFVLSSIFRSPDLRAIGDKKMRQLIGAMLEKNFKNRPTVEEVLRNIT